MTMTIRDFLASFALAAGLMALLSLVEIALPLHPRAGTGRGRARANITLTIMVFALNWLLMTGVAMIAVRFSAQVGPAALSRIPALAQVLLGVAILDFFTYVAHLGMHKVPLLWRFHRVHHSDPFVDATTSFRFHPMEGIWRFLWILAPALAFGIPAHAILVYRLISLANGLFEHTNLAVPRSVDRALSVFWVTPNMHKVHHSNSPQQADSNYGNITSWFDRLFGTFTPTDRAFGVEYGLRWPDPEQVRSLPGLLRMPFESEPRSAGSLDRAVREP
jgi:sterol desaturase/sphingolipid hydroxylase (fatty acid hydroxylase superfamily)